MKALNFIKQVSFRIMSSHTTMQVLATTSLTLILTIIFNASLVTEHIHFKTKTLFLSTQTIELDIMTAILSSDKGWNNQDISQQHINHALQETKKLRQGILKERWLSHSLNNAETQQNITSIQKHLHQINQQLKSLNNKSLSGIIQGIKKQTAAIQIQIQQLKDVINASIEKDFSRLSLFRASVALLILFTIIGTSIFLRFIENRHQNHEEKESLLAEFPEENPTPVLFIDQNMKLAYCNYAAEILLPKLGLSIDGVINKTWVGYCKKAIQQPLGYHHQVEILAASYSLFFKRSAENHIHVYIHDTTELRNVQREQKILADIIEKTSDVVSIAKPDGTFIYMNKAGRILLGIDQHTDISQHKIFDFHSQEECQRITSDIIPFALEQGKWEGEAMYIQADGDECPASCLVLATHDNEGNPSHFSIISRNLKEQREMQAKLEHKQRLESLGVLAGGIAHDFNNLLTIIMGNASLASSRFNDTHPTNKYIHHITSAGKKAAQLCNQMLAYSGKGSFIVKPTHLSKFISEMTQLLEVSISKDVNMVYHLSHDIPLILADIAQLQQVILNLITNANDAMEGKHGSIHIDVKTFWADETYLRNAYVSNTLEQGEYVMLRVSDEGCGMSKDIIERIFEPFFTTKVAGHGLGMSAVLGIIQGHHGTLYIQSELNKGSKFSILFPTVDAPITREDKINLLTLNSNSQQQGILVVDDDAMIRETSCEILNDLGFTTCFEAADGVEAVEQYQLHQTEIQLVLLDMTMPRLDGEGALYQLRQANPNVPIILCSGYSEQDIRPRFEHDKLVSFIQKPYTPNILQEHIENILQLKRT